MNILFFSHQAEYLFGGEVVTLAFLRELLARGVGVHFASPPGPYAEQAAALGARVHRVESRQFSRSLNQVPGIARSFPRARAELRAILARENIHVLHATSLKAMAYAWGLGVPTIWHHHDILPASFANSLWLRGLAAKAARVLAPSQATRAALLEAGITPGKVRVLRNGFRPSEWRPRPPRQEGRVFRLGLVGEISPRKGTDRLEALLGALGQEPVEVWVIGEGLSDPAFAASLKARLSSERVRFLGRRADVKELYQELDALFVPSRQDPLPTVIVEAGLSGVPVIGARVGGIPEMILPGENGFVFEEIEQAAAAVREIRANWNRFSARARALAEERYDIERLTGELLQQYEEVANG